jgi:hypothetical protein
MAKMSESTKLEMIGGLLAITFLAVEIYHLWKEGFDWFMGAASLILAAIVFFVAVWAVERNNK